MRVKVFHSLYAYRQLTGGAFFSIVDKAERDHTPLHLANSTTIARQKREKLALLASLKEEQEAGVLYAVPHEKREASERPSPPPLGAPVAEVLHYRETLRELYKQQYDFFEKEVEKIKDLHAVLCLVLGGCVRWEREQGVSLSERSEGAPSFPLGGNPFLAACGQRKKSTQHFISGIFSATLWEALVSKWRRETLEKGSFYLKYCQIATPSLREHSQVISRIITSFFSHAGISQYLSTHDLFSSENRAIVREFFLKEMRQVKKKEDIPCAFGDTFSNFAPVLCFMHSLYEAVLSSASSSHRLLSGVVAAWDLERVCVTDLVLLSMAVAEFRFFREVPVRVVLNEYVDLAKLYGTNESHRFVNGVLEGVLGRTRGEAQGVAG